MLSNFEKAIVLGDTHIPFQDKETLYNVFKFLKEFKPDKIFLNGDVVDFYELSPFDKNPDRQTDLQAELDDAQYFLRCLRRACPKADMVYVRGNHEYRLQRYLWQNPELHSLRDFQLDNLLRLGELGIKYINPQTPEAYTKYGEIIIGHFFKANKHSAYTAKNLLDEKGTCIIQNHTHRGGTHYRTMIDRTIVGAENFCLCGLLPEYNLIPNWQQGFTVIYRKIKSHGGRNSLRFHLHQVPIIENRFIFNGREY